jgi:hypothetical protein
LQAFPANSLPDRRSMLFGYDILPRIIGMKLRVSEGCCAVSHAGQPIEIADDGSVEVKDDARNVLISHGFIPWEDERKTPNLPAMTREQLITQAIDMTMKTIETIGDEDIRARLVVAEASTPPDEREDDGASVVVSDIGIEDMPVLRRRELFAFLKAKGVTVALPVTNEELRAAARHMLDS